MLFEQWNSVFRNGFKSLWPFFNCHKWASAVSSITKLSFTKRLEIIVMSLTPIYSGHSSCMQHISLYFYTFSLFLTCWKNRQLQSISSHKRKTSNWKNHFPLFNQDEVCSLFLFRSRFFPLFQLGESLKKKVSVFLFLHRSIKKLKDEKRSWLVEYSIK